MAHQIEDKALEEEEEYDENADKDFNPEAREQEDASSSSSDDETAPAAKPVPRGGRKRKSAAVVDGELDSGDEETMQERKKKRRKETTAKDDEDDSGGEGGLIKTRAQRLAEKIERKYRKRTREGDVTIDVEELWAELNAIPVGRVAPPVPKVEDLGDGDVDMDKENHPAKDGLQKDEGDEMITIKRRIEYAGEVTEVEEKVPRKSTEAQRYLAEHPEADPNYKAKNIEGKEILRPLKRPSRFEPNPTGLVKGVPPDRLRPRAPSRLDVLMAEQRAEEERKKKAEKLTTVQKSALDWRGFVDQQGLREELDEYGKSKHGFLAREDFLGRAQFAREVAAREARLKR